ncbi:hypothetical protein DRQ09_01485 [candidate division KSB1 bacterium]|nr:MAG: hypothetical protein DRQ09_01485 [candidate division KSB1 bacterium]
MILLYIFILSHLSFNTLQFQIKTDFYTEGIKEKNRGNWQRAIDIWLMGKETLSRLGKTDPRMGIAFIELVTEKKLKRYYETACQMYYWGFSRNSINEYRKNIKKEIERITPIMRKEQSKYWFKALKDNDTTICSKIRGFWIEKDPTPTTVLNERLITHWERITYARKNFNRNKRTAYGTDDRGMIYVKYGEPDRKKTGTFGLNDSELQFWIGEVLDAIPNIRISTLQVKKNINLYNWLSDYEVWIYSYLSPEEPIIYMFGSPAGRPFGLVNGVDDFIPDRAYRKTSLIQLRKQEYSMGDIYSIGILPGSLLQLMYYSELVSFDSYFERRYLELESTWKENLIHAHPPNYHTLRSFRERFRMEDVNYPARKLIPPEKVEEIALPIELTCHQVRFIDDENKPELAVMAFSYPRGLTKRNLKNVIEKKDITDYNLKHTLIIRDKNWNEINRIVDIPEKKNDNTSIFIIPHTDSTLNYMLSAEAFDRTSADSIIGIGKISLKNTVPLSPAPETLEVSDLVVGINLPVGADMSRFPFPVLPTSHIWKGDKLQVYIEIYHLLYGRDNRTHYTIKFQYEVVKKRGIISRLFRRGKKKEIVSIVHRFDSPSRTAKEKITFDVSNLNPGKYDFLVEVTDIISMQKKIRKGKFEIKE